MSDCEHQLFFIKVYSASEDDEEENILVGSRGITCEDCGKTMFDIQQENSDLRAKLEATEQERDEARQQGASLRSALEEILAYCTPKLSLFDQTPFEDICIICQEALANLDGDSNVT